jgi:biotin carboxylase
MAFLIIYGFSEGFPGHWSLLKRWIAVGHKLWLISESPDQTRLSGVVRWDSMSREAQKDPRALPWAADQWKWAASADGVICLWEQSVVGAAHLASRLGLRGPDPQAAEFARNKWLMVQKWRSAGIRTPFSQPIHDRESLVQLLTRLPKIVVKPTDSGGGFGVQEVTANWIANDSAWDDLRTSRKVSLLAQEKIDGPEVSVEGFVDHTKRYHPLGVTAKYTTVGPRFIEMGHMAPAPINATEIAQIYRLATQCHDALGLRDCVTHLEVKLCHDGLVPVELAARVAGGEIPDIWASMNHFDLYDVAFRLAIKKFPVAERPIAKRAAAVIFPTVRLDWPEVVREMGLELLELRSRNVPQGFAVSDNSGRWQLVRIRGDDSGMVLKFIDETFRREAEAGSLGLQVIGLSIAGGAR